jgi:hypothetical protein
MDEASTWRLLEPGELLNVDSHLATRSSRLTRDAQHDHQRRRGGRGSAGRRSLTGGADRGTLDGPGQPPPVLAPRDLRDRHVLARHP